MLSKAVSYCWDKVKRLTIFSKKSKHQRKIERMMSKASQCVPPYLAIPSDYTRTLRARLVLEEAFELVEALGVTVYTADPTNGATQALDFSNFTFAIIGKPDMWSANTDEKIQYLTNVAKEAADLSVVTIGTLSAHGIPDLSLLDAVDENNLGKFGPGSYKSEAGKWIKPKGYKKPNLKHILGVDDSTCKYPWTIEQ